LVSGDWSLKRALARILLVALCVAALGGCSLLRVGYGQFDTYAAWTADRYFDLDAGQRQEFLNYFDRLHAWHRYEQLPDYAAFLGETKSRVQKGITRDDVAWVTEGAKARYRTILRRMAPDAAAMLMTITPAQIEALQRRWDYDNRRFIREYRLEDGLDEQRQARVERVLSRIQDWTGSLSTEQESRIAAMAKALPLIHGLRHQDRLRRQREFLELMARRKDARRFAAELRDWLIDWEKGRDPEYDRLFREWELKQADVYVAVDRMLTPQQRAAAVARLQRYMDDFTRLSERPAAQPAASR
jgi:hypothetical protein